MCQPSSDCRKPSGANRNRKLFQFIWCAQPKKSIKNFIKRSGKCVFSDNKVHGKGIYCDAQCFCLTRIKVGFRSAVYLSIKANNDYQKKKEKITVLDMWRKWSEKWKLRLNWTKSKGNTSLKTIAKKVSKTSCSLSEQSKFLAENIC